MKDIENMRYLNQLQQHLPPHYEGGMLRGSRKKTEVKEGRHKE